MGSFLTFLFLLKAVDWLEVPNEVFSTWGMGCHWETKTGLDVKMMMAWIEPVVAMVV